MPKILENIENRIIDVARNEIILHPDHAPSLRLIAKKAGIAVGTIYNYYPNKETLMVKVLIHDWQEDLRKMDTHCAEAKSLMEGIGAICAEVRSFYDQYIPLFQSMPVNSKKQELNYRHVQFRKELQGRVDELLERFGLTDKKKLSTLYTEALITAVIQPDIQEEDLTVFTQELFQLKEE